MSANLRIDHASVMREPSVRSRVRLARRANKSPSRHSSTLLFLVRAVHLGTSVRISQAALDISASLFHAFTGHCSATSVNALIALMRQLEGICAGVFGHRLARCGLAKIDQPGCVA